MIESDKRYKKEGKVIGLTVRQWATDSVVRGAAPEGDI